MLRQRESRAKSCLVYIVQCDMYNIIGTCNKFARLYEFIRSQALTAVKTYEYIDEAECALDMFKGLVELRNRLSNRFAKKKEEGLRLRGLCVIVAISRLIGHSSKYMN